MTTNMIIKSAPTSHNEVQVIVTGQPDTMLQPGQETTISVYPGRDILIVEGPALPKAGGEDPTPQPQSGAGDAGVPSDGPAATATT